MQKININKEWLQEQYKIKSVVNIAKELNCSTCTVNKYINEFKINKKPKNTIRADYFKNINSEDKAYWLGFLMADGGMYKSRKCKSHRLDITLKDSDVEILNSFKTDIECSDSVKFRKFDDKRGFVANRCVLRVSNMMFCNDLMRHGIVPNKTGKEYMPTLDSNLQRHFIRGFFDGDGSITKAGAFRICSSSKQILDSINDVFISQLDVSFNIYTDNRYTNPFYTIDSRNCVKNYKVLEYLYKDCNHKLERKYYRFKNIISPLYEKKIIK